MDVGALGWNPCRSAEDGNEIERVETELYPCIFHCSEALTCRCVSLRRRVELGVPNPAGGRRVTDLQGVGTSDRGRKLKWPHYCGYRVVIHLTKPVERLSSVNLVPCSLEKQQ